MTWGMELLVFPLEFKSSVVGWSEILASQSGHAKIVVGWRKLHASQPRFFWSLVGRKIDIVVPSYRGWTTATLTTLHPRHPRPRPADDRGGHA